MKLYASKPLLPRETHTEITSQEKRSMAAHRNMAYCINKAGYGGGMSKGETRVVKE